MTLDARIEHQIGGSISGVRLAAMTWRDYHEATKHSVESLRRAGHVLDWTNMPDPFRYYEGVPVLDLPADPPAPEIPAFDVLQGASGTTPAMRRTGFPLAASLLFRRNQRLQACPLNRRKVCAKSESVLREPAPDGISLRDTGPERVAGWVVSLRSIQAHGGAAWTRRLCNDASQRLCPNCVCFD